MNITQIEKNLKNLIDSFDKDEFIYDLLLAYGRPKSSITRLKSTKAFEGYADSDVDDLRSLFL